jgi:methylmalonyl-CoA mutase, N-terminal domain
VERLTTDMEAEAQAYFDRIDGMGGMVPAIEAGFPQREIADSAYRFQQALERREKIIVGVNDFVQPDDQGLEILYIGEAVAEQQLRALDELRATRDNVRVVQALDRLSAAAGTTENLMPAILDAVRAYATVGEMCDALRRVWGEYVETPVV